MLLLTIDILVGDELHTPAIAGEGRERRRIHLV